MILLGEQISHPPYILGNFPRIEIVFALADSAEGGSRATPQHDKYAELEKLKRLLDQGALTREEFEKEKARLLN
jgi:hypothetical protein